MIECDLRLDCDNSTVEAVTGFVGLLSHKAELPRGKAYWLRLAAEEITTNIAQHGYRGTGPVRLTGGIQADRVWLRIEDKAPAFDPGTYDPGPRLATKPSEREAGGFGLLLALHKLDEFCYERAGGTNRNTLIMYREAAGGVSHAMDGVPDGDVTCPDRR